MRNQPEPKPFEIHSARALGISDLRVGRHPIRDANGDECGAVCLESIWTLRIKPSFAIHGFLTVATADGLNCGGRKSPGWRRAFLRSDTGEELISNNVAETVETILGNIPLLIKSNVITKDGIGYELIWQSSELSGTMQFYNPQSEIPRSLEMACLDLADSLTKQSGGQRLFKFVEEWKRNVRNDY